MVNHENMGASDGVGMEMVAADSPATKEKCESTIVFGDDYGDNHTTFKCQLEKGHAGKHAESGDQGYGVKPHPYRLEWEGDSEKIFDGGDDGKKDDTRGAHPAP